MRARNGISCLTCPRGESITHIYIELLWLIGFSSLVYVEADANLRTYEDAEGKKQSHLNLTQREYFQTS